MNIDIPTKSQRKYLVAMYRARHRGLTDHEAAFQTRLPLSSICSTRNGIMRRWYGMIESTGEKRLSPYGKEAGIYNFSPFGLTAAVKMLGRYLSDAD